MSVAYIQLGDMLVMDKHAPLMIKALAVIASELHQTYDTLPDVVPGNSKKACLFTSLVTRDFLVAIGFKDATVAPCAVIMRADQRGTELHSIGIGTPGQATIEDKFNGHAVVLVPSRNILIDTTLYQAIRPVWRGAVTGMMAVPIDRSRMIWDMPSLGGATLSSTEDDVVFEIGWGARPEINWRRQPDATRQEQRIRRRIISTRMVETFDHGCTNK